MSAPEFIGEVAWPVAILIVASPIVVLFAAESIDHLVDAVGGFFAEFDDETPARLAARAARAAA